MLKPICPICGRSMIQVSSRSLVNDSIEGCRIHDLYRISIPWGLVANFLRKLKKLVKLEIKGGDIPTDVVHMRGYPYPAKVLMFQIRQ
jgi:hypothetical protein